VNHSSPDAGPLERNAHDLAGLSQGFQPRLPVGLGSSLPQRGPHRRPDRLPADFAEFCVRVLASIPRADQRRWGEFYVRGLLTVRGRKTITRIVQELAAPPADQSLQQFVNQSPWDWQAVRRDLAQVVEQSIAPQAWVAEPVCFPKSGDRSVGVARQFVPQLRRLVNCQTAVSVWLAGTEASCPVDWSLVLPQRWTDDPRRRASAGIPAEKVAQEPWECMLELVIGLAQRLGVPQRPVVVDLRHGWPLRVLELLAAHRIPLVALVAPSTLVHVVPPGAGRPPAGAGRPLTAANVAAAVDARPQPVPWRGPDQQRRVSHVTAVPVLPHPAPRPRAVGPSRAERPLLLLAERAGGDPHPRCFAVTTMLDTSPAELLQLVKLRLRVSADHDHLVDERGLTDFEGRSYRGWQHHVTLVSAARGYEAMRLGTASQFRAG
jgi:DDE superfamily endonuclease